MRLDPSQRYNSLRTCNKSVSLVYYFSIEKKGELRIARYWGYRNSEALKTRTIILIKTNNLCNESGAARIRDRGRKQLASHYTFSAMTRARNDVIMLKLLFFFSPRAPGEPAIPSRPRTEVGVAFVSRDENKLATFSREICRRIYYRRRWYGADVHADNLWPSLFKLALKYSTLIHASKAVEMPRWYRPGFN